MRRPTLARAAAAPLPLLALVTLALLTTACATTRQPAATAATTPTVTPTVTAAALPTPASTEPPAPAANAATSAPPAAPSAASFAAPPAALQRHWSGRLALLIETDPPQHWSARFELSGDPSAGELLLSSPLGQALARAHWQPGLAQLEHQGRRYAFADLDALSAQLLGVAVPLPPLFAWLQGQPQALDGWHIDASQQARGRLLVRRLQPLPLAELRLALDPAPPPDAAAPAPRALPTPAAEPLPASPQP